IHVYTWSFSHCLPKGDNIRVSPFDMYTIGSELWKLAKEYGKGPGPSMEMQYKHGMPGGKW
ncbi:hypothetical protein, partial [Bacillus paranthracis]|uniref:hypothetical protein n=1 Tax=Bacillus paranthracis TaxID=2026186 RepID=UPI001E30865B